METDYLFPAEIRGMLRIIRILEHSNIRFWTNPFYCRNFADFFNLMDSLWNLRENECCYYDYRDNDCIEGNCDNCINKDGFFK